RSSICRAPVLKNCRWVCPMIWKSPSKKEVPWCVSEQLFSGSGLIRIVIIGTKNNFISSWSQMLHEMSQMFYKGNMLWLLILLLPFYGFTQELSSKQIDSVVYAAMKTFDVPGMAVAVVKEGKIHHKNTYGIRSVKTQAPVNENTLFGVASNTKAFTAAALGQLVDQGKLEWDQPVTDIIPEFKLYDAYVTREFTVRDLLVHRSGLGLGAGDLMVFPAQNTTTLEEMIHNLRYLKPVSSFRSKYDYDNLLYIVAGEVVARVSGQDYDSYIRENFFEPLRMKRSFLSLEKIEAD